MSIKLQEAAQASEEVAGSTLREALLALALNITGVNITTGQVRSYSEKWVDVMKSMDEAEK